jgi:hypothetical protein
MGRKRSPRQRLLDTTAVVYRLHGHMLQQAAVGEAVADGDVLVQVFVRMEYLRGVILNLVEIAHQEVSRSATSHRTDPVDGNSPSDDRCRAFPQ